MVFLCLILFEGESVWCGGCDALGTLLVGRQCVRREVFCIKTVNWNCGCEGG